MVKDLKVDNKRCTGCGTCVNICPTMELKLDEKKKPQALKLGETCFRCGHCIAACPTAAISIEDMTPENCAPFRREMLPPVEQVEILLKSRRSIRNYQPKQVPREIIKGLIEIARYSPSGLNAQPVQWTVIYNRSDVKRYATMTIDWLKSIREDPAWMKRLPIETYVGNWEKGLETITFEAPHLVVVHAEARWEEECKMALTFFDLAAHSRGLGTCWMGLFNLAANLWEPLKRDLAFPETHKSFGAMTLGYPKYNFLRVPPRKEPVITWK
jgi:nitroreductase/NAD-dependent dihydropyrimidine dehydrogenase PreA subunit